MALDAVFSKASEETEEDPTETVEEAEEGQPLASNDIDEEPIGPLSLLDN